jgi:hypothetical protein
MKSELSVHHSHMFLNCAKTRNPADKTFFIIAKVKSGSGWWFPTSDLRPLAYGKIHRFGTQIQTTDF